MASPGVFRGTQKAKAKAHVLTNHRQCQSQWDDIHNHAVQLAASLDYYHESFPAPVASLAAATAVKKKFQLYNDLNAKL